MTVLWFKLNGNAREELSGNEATTEGSPVKWEGGRFGQGLALAGAANLSFAVNDAWRQVGENGKVTLSAWIYVDVIKPGFQAIVTQAKANSKVETVGLFLKDGKPTMTMDFFSVSASTAVPINTWVHVAGKFDGLIQEIYVNGELAGRVGNASTIPVDDSEPILIGANRNEGVVGERFWGRIDDVSVFSRSLSNPEIQTLSCR
jgi:hypothetical protein